MKWARLGPIATAAALGVRWEVVQANGGRRSPVSGTIALGANLTSEERQQRLRQFGSPSAPGLATVKRDVILRHFTTQAQMRPLIIHVAGLNTSLKPGPNRSSHSNHGAH